MHIVLYHNAIVPPLRYGGTERVIYWLAQALIDLGNQVTLIAARGSKVPRGNLIEIDPHNPSPWENLIPAGADLLHLWATPKNLPKLPYLVTIEGNGQKSEIFLPNTVFVSKKHAELHGSQNYVYNGIDTSQYPCDEKREPYLVFLAKASWKVKNLPGAIEIAKKANLKLKIIGSRNLPFRLNRLLSSNWKQIQYLGMLNDQQKIQILRKAKALLFPVRWHEPFGIALTESLASGCPVYGTPYGSLPEIVTPDVGKLSIHADELADAIRNQTISPKVCRQRVLEQFNHIQMAQSYLKYYQEVLDRGSLSNQSQPLSWKLSDSSQTLLPWNDRHAQ